MTTFSTTTLSSYEALLFLSILMCLVILISFESGLVWLILIDENLVADFGLLKIFI